MLVSDLTEVETRKLAKKIRRFLEPKGSHLVRSASESEVRKYISSLGYNVTIQGMSDILNILRSHYAEKTVHRLNCKIKKGAVLDASLCCLETTELLSLYYHNDGYMNIITSLTAEEITKLAESRKPNSHNAVVLMNCILRDTDSKYSMSVALEKSSSYVDTDLLDYCSDNNYSLFTYDQRLVLRARSRHITVVHLNKGIHSPYSYIPNSSGKDILLDESVLSSGRSLKDVLSDAKTLGCGKFLITREFVETLESEKDRDSIKKFIYFLLADEHGEYSHYISETTAVSVSSKKSCKAMSLEDIARKYNAIIFTTDSQKALGFRTASNDNFWYIPSTEERILIAKTRELLDFPEFSSFPSTSKSSLEEIHNSQKDTSYTIDSDGVSLTDDLTELVPDAKHRSVDALSMSNSATTSPIKNLPKLNRFVTTVSVSDRYIICRIPFFNDSKKRMSKKLQVNSKIWILDRDNKLVEIETQLQKSFTVIHFVNGLDGKYYLNVYTILEKEEKLFGELVFSKVFSKKGLKEIPPKYRDYAEKGCILT